jgi:hypothetical protein
MNDPAIQKTVCHGCYAVLDATDHYCRHCGTPTGTLAGVSDNSGACTAVVKPATRILATLALEPSARRPGHAESPWVVLPMLFLVLGPLGLPMLWRSRQFSLLWKCVLTAFMLGVTALLIWGIWFVTHQALSPLHELDKLRGF